MCWVCFELDNFPFFLKSMALWLSWWSTISLSWKPWACRKLFVHSRMDMKTLAATSLVSVQLLVLSFCLIELEITMPEPRVMQPPKCLLQLEWVPCEPLTYHLAVLVQSLFKIKGKSGVAWRYHIIKCSFFQLSWSGHVTQVVRNATTIAMSGWACLVRKSALATKV